MKKHNHQLVAYVALVEIMPRLLFARSAVLVIELNSNVRVNIELVHVQERPELVPGETIDHVIQHEVKELGTHILVCDVSYTSPTADRLNFRKFFKFQVFCLLLSRSWLVPSIVADF